MCRSCSKETFTKAGQHNVDNISQCYKHTQFFCNKRCNPMSLESTFTPSLIYALRAINQTLTECCTPRLLFQTNSSVQKSVPSPLWALFNRFYYDLIKGQQKTYYLTYSRESSNLDKSLLIYRLILCLQIVRSMTSGINRKREITVTNPIHFSQRRSFRDLRVPVRIPHISKEIRKLEITKVPGTNTILTFSSR